MKHRIYNCLLSVCIIALFFCVNKIIQELCEAKRQEAVFGQLLDLFPVSDGKERIDSKDNIRLSGHEKLWEQNHDYVGWLCIDNTSINYPVMQRQDFPDYYLDHNFYREKSTYGVPYLPDICELGLNDNLLIYGHNMKNGSMFAPLKNYRKSDFYKEHLVIRFDTFKEEAIFEVIGAWLIPNVTVETKKVNELYALLFPQSEAEFTFVWESIKTQLFLKTDKELSVNNRLLAMVTCDYTFNDSRIIVLSKQLE